MQREMLGGAGFYPTEGLLSGMSEVVKLYFFPQTQGTKIRAKEHEYTKLYIKLFPEYSKAVSLYGKFDFYHISHTLGNSGHPAVTI